MIGLGHFHFHVPPPRRPPFQPSTHLPSTINHQIQLANHHLPSPSLHHQPTVNHHHCSPFTTTHLRSSFLRHDNNSTSPLSPFPTSSLISHSTSSAPNYRTRLQPPSSPPSTPPLQHYHRPHSPLFFTNKPTPTPLTSPTTPISAIATHFRHAACISISAPLFSPPPLTSSTILKPKPPPLPPHLLLCSLPTNPPQLLSLPPTTPISSISIEHLRHRSTILPQLHKSFPSTAPHRPPTSSTTLLLPSTFTTVPLLVTLPFHPHPPASSPLLHLPFPHNRPASVHQPSISLQSLK